MKSVSKILSTIFAIISLTMCFSLFGCAEETKYSLSVTGSQLLYEEINDKYAAGEEVTVKVKITPNESTVAYLDLIPLTKTKNSGDDFYTLTFTMPSKPTVLTIENKKGFSEDLLTGFYLTFSKDDNPIESMSQDLKSPDAIAEYLYTYVDEEIGKPVLTSNDGADVFADGKTHVTNVFEEIELEDNLYFTYELLGAVAFVDWVYLNDETGELTSENSSGHQLDDIGYSSTFNTQSLTDTRYNAKGEEYEKTFNSDIKINFKFIDYLTGVKVLEYDKNNRLIKSSIITGENRLEAFTVCEACEYAVIEEEYTVMSGEHKDEKHYDRTLINKTTLGGGKNLKYPRGDGLISPIYLSIKWAE